MLSDAFGSDGIASNENEIKLIRRQTSPQFTHPMQSYFFQLDHEISPCESFVVSISKLIDRQREKRKKEREREKKREKDASQTAECLQLNHFQIAQEWTV